MQQDHPNLKRIHLGHVKAGDEKEIERGLYVFLNGRDVTKLVIVEADDIAGYLICYELVAGNSLKIDPTTNEPCRKRHDGTVEFFLDTSVVDLKDAAVRSRLSAKART